jgi:hypothetical protein
MHALRTAKRQVAFDFPNEEIPVAVVPIAPTKKSKRTGAFTDNMSLPVHRWFRYSAGFSAEWVGHLIDKHLLTKSDVLFDPFAGSGTTMLAAQGKGISAIGAETHYFVRRIANTKLLWNRPDEHKFFELSEALLKKAAHRERNQPVPASALLQKCYLPETLRRLTALRDAYTESYSDYGVQSELLWLAITAILRECSGVGTAQWQYVLPNKTKAKVRDPYVAFRARVQMFCADIEHMRSTGEGSNATVEAADARTLTSFDNLQGRVKLIVTSPPYPNNYDYADATRLEMTFWGDIEGWGDLQHAVRRHLIRSCSQHSAAEHLSLDDLLADDAIAPIRDELTTVCQALSAIRETKGGKKTYHTMVAAYFVDLAKCWHALHNLCTSDAHVYFVIGDSAPYGIYVPADRWLGELALAAGFRDWSFEKIRDRNIKWKNRKHRVPLKEGNLLVRN